MKRHEVSHDKENEWIPYPILFNALIYDVDDRLNDNTMLGNGRGAA